MKVSLIIPTRNESESIGKVLKEIPKRNIFEIIVVDGKSTDNTKSEVRKHIRPKKDKFLVQKKAGFGNALQQAFKAAKGDLIIILNGDGSHDPRYIHSMIKKISQGYDYVMASRYTKGGGSYDDTKIRFVGNKLFTLLINLIYKANFTDSLFFFAAIRKKSLETLTLKSSGFELCAEVLIKAKKKKLRFAEVAAVERVRFGGKSKVNAFSDGIKILRVVLQKY